MQADPAPRYEVLLDVPTESALGAARRLLVPAIVGLALAASMPYQVGVAVALPLLFAMIGVRVGTLRPRATTVRFFEDVLEIASTDVVHRMGWEHFTGVKETSQGVVIALPGGREIAIPLAQLPADRRVLIDALPAHVRFEVVAAAPPKHNARRTVGLWLALIALFTIAYYLMRQP